MLGSDTISDYEQHEWKWGMRSRTEKTEDEKREVFLREKWSIVYWMYWISKLLTKQSIYTERMN